MTPLDRGAAAPQEWGRNGIAMRSSFLSAAARPSRRAPPAWWRNAVLRLGTALAMALLVAASPLSPVGRASAAGPTEGAAPPYDGDLMRLAEILGALHYLRPLCGVAAEAQRWRSEMQALIDTEQPSEGRRAKIIASFNRGYSSYAEVYRSCTPAARVAVDRQLDEGAKLAHDIVVRYGGN